MDQGQAEIVSQAEFARMLGVSRQYVGKLIARGTIRLTPEKKVLVQEATKALGRQVGPRLSGPGAQAPEPAANPDRNIAAPVHDGGQPAAPPIRGATEASAPPSPPPPAFLENESQGVLKLGSGNFMEARTFSEQLKGLLSHLKYQQEIGDLVEAEQVRHEAFEVARRTRDALLAIGERVAPVLAAENDSAKIHELLNREIRQACEELANGLAFAGRSRAAKVETKEQ